MNPRLYSFSAGNLGLWKIRSIVAIRGEVLPNAERLEVAAGDHQSTQPAWILRGTTSNERYITRGEKDQLAAKQENLGRAKSSCAALLPIKKTAAWWALPQDERRKIFEEHSHHTQIGLNYLPAIARRLHHCRDLTTTEPFDFLTWFEYQSEDESAFNDLLAQLRASAEWAYVEREVDIRLEK